MQDPFARWSPGQRIKGIRASTWNSILEATRAHLAGRRGGSGGGWPGLAVDPAVTLLVKNGGAAALPARSVVTYGTPLVTPDADPYGVQGRPAVAAGTPAASTDQFAVLLEPVAAGKVGRAAAAGLVVVKVDVSDAGHAWAVPSSGVTANLVSASSGGVPVLWKESGTGVKWALALLPATQAAAGTEDVQAVTLTEATGLYSWQGRQTNSGGTAWENSTATGTDDTLAVEMDGAVFVPKLTASGILFVDARSGRKGFLPVQAASQTHAGYVTAAAQTFGGVKTFYDQVVVNSAGTTGVNAVTVYVGASALYRVRAQGGSVETFTGSGTWSTSGNVSVVNEYGFAVQRDYSGTLATATLAAEDGSTIDGSASGLGARISMTATGSPGVATLWLVPNTGKSRYAVVEATLVSTTEYFGEWNTDAIGNVFSGGIASTVQTSAATARANLGLGAIATESGATGTINLGTATSITVSNGAITGWS